MTSKMTEEQRRKLEADLVYKRRILAGQRERFNFTIGLALSGGGIRSATFCFGLVRALAKNRILPWFDYLSTVSGGGYTGAMLGRLYSKMHSPAKVQEGLASDSSLLLWWMRSNGRYLIPAGLADIVLAFASALRGFIATQFEVIVLTTLFSWFVIAPHVLTSFWQVFDNSPWGAVPTVWWWLIPVPLLIGAVVAFAYWFSADDSTRGVKLTHGAMAIAALLSGVLVAAWLTRVWLENTLVLSQQLVILSIVAAILFGVVAGYVLRASFAISKKSAPELRLLFTRILASMLFAAGGLALLGAYDALSWFVVSRFQGLILGGGAIITGSSVASLGMIRAVAPIVQRFLRRHKWNGDMSARVANITGLMLLALLALVWTILVATFVALPSPVSLPFEAAVAPDFAPLAKWSALFVITILYIGMTGWNLAQVNLASLHYLYRARLARAYVSTGNVGPIERKARFHTSPLNPASRKETARIAPLVESIAGDDIQLRAYRPHVFGGPIHLINCCINQTVDDRTGNYNADRKGVALTVSALGVETGTKLPEGRQLLKDSTLAQWGVVSGAAVGSGMGSLTSPGLAALIFLSGMRTGYWSKSMTTRHDTVKPQSFMARTTRAATIKYRATLCELFARFPGLGSDYWYVSDGGHFDNTGVYALIKRQVGLIVLADCGADPRYLFSDIENLVRKALIDYAAIIEFLDPASIAEYDSSFRCLIGTPDTIGPEPGDRYLMVARITYSNGEIGALIVVKPRRLTGLPLDIVGYSDRDNTFPQQTTGDQLFDEAQWESYHGLGLQLGRAIDAGFLSFARRWTGLE